MLIYIFFQRTSHKLLGHSDSVCSVALNSQLDICVSGGCDGVVVLHSLRAGRRLRVLRMAEAEIPNVIAVSSVGAIFVRFDLMY